MTMKEKLEQEIKELQSECKAIREKLKEKFDFDTFEFLHEMQTKGYEYKVHSVKFVNTYSESGKSIAFNVIFQDDESIMIFIEAE